MCLPRWRYVSAGDRDLQGVSVMWKRCLYVVLCVSLVGCGCNDQPPVFVRPTAADSQLQVAFELPICEVPYTPNTLPIDIVFVIDDSLFMNAANGMGVVPTHSNDNRSRSLVAQRIMADLRTKLKSRLLEDQVHGLLPADVVIDLAYSVVRFEDFGGQTVPYQTASGIIDAGARPYILNMPVLREDRPDFQAAFNAALARTATDGDGNPMVNGQLRQDPQTAIEALWQIATGAGFDGNGAGGTLDNGAPCSANAQGTGLNAFTDVPAVQFSLIGTDPQDADWNEYAVQDEAGGGEPGCVSSGNIGGVGFRPDSLRFVILATDIASVAPFEDAVGNPQAPPPGARVLPDGAATSPFVPAPAFDGITGRFGAAGSPGVAPVGAASVQETITRLNELGIEVLALGAPGVQPGPVKPNLPGATPGEAIDAILQPQSPSFTPYTFESALSLLTGSQISDDTGSQTGLFPAVFNLGNIGALDMTAQDPLVPTSFATKVEPDLITGMRERIRVRAPLVAPGGLPPELPVVTYTITVSVDTAAGGAAVRTPLPNATTASYRPDVYYRNTRTGSTFRVVGGAAVPYDPPTNGVQRFATDRSYVLDTDVAEPPFSFSAPFSIAHGGPVLSGATPDNAAQLTYIQDKLADAGPESGAGVMTITLNEGTPVVPLPNGMLLEPGYAGWCVILQDRTWGAAPEKDENEPRWRPFDTCTGAPAD